MDIQSEAMIEVSFAKTLLLSAFSMTCFFALLFFFIIDWPIRDPLLIVVLVVMGIGMPPVFTAVICFMLRCKINSEGLWPAVPTFYQHVLRWDDMTAVRSTSVFVRGPFYLVKGRGLGEFCLLPRPFLLKRPDSLKQLIEQYAPEGNIVRRELAA
jgi:hypothetical protein